MTRTLATITSLLLLAIQMQPSSAFDAEERALVEFAFSQFEEAGIRLPEVDIDFPDEPTDCFGYGGIYSPSTHRVRICRPSKSTMIHELAHAWIETSFSSADKEAFLDLRALESWVGGDEWNERGAEQAAEIVTWALMDEDITHHWIETEADGTTTRTRRLLKVPNTDLHELATAYEQLTGSLPHNRVGDIGRASEARPEPTSPEARRG